MSAVDPVPPTAAGVGADLRAAREQCGWTLPQVATALRIRLSYLEALEEGRIGLLPGNAYAVAFMRSYAQILGLDPEEILRRFRREAAEVNARPELEFPAPLPERGIPAGAIIVVGLVIAIGGYAVWWHGGGAPAPAPRVAEVPARLAEIVPPPHTTVIAPRPASGDTGAATGAASPGQAPATDTAEAGAAGTPASAAPATTSPDTTGAGASGTTTGSGQPAPATTQAPAPKTPDVSPASALAATSPNPPSAVAAAAANTIVIGATADAWLEVRDPDGHVLLNRILHKGDTWTVPDQTGLELTTGNAGGTTVTVGKLVIPSLGGNGAVRRNLPLDPAAIRAGGLADNTAPQTPTAGAPKTNE